MSYFSYFKMIILLIFFVTVSSVMAESIEEAGNKSTDVIKIEDSSGLSNTEIRKIAEEVDKEKTGYGKFVPPTDRYDWIELTSGEWLKGTFKGMYRKQLEFDSDKLDLMTLEFKDVRQIRTHRIVTVNVFMPDAKGEGYFGYRNRSLEITGILRLNETKMMLVQGNGIREYDRNLIISIAYGSEKSGDRFSGKVDLGLNVSTGNSDTLDYTAMATIKYLVAKARIQLDYLGKILTANQEETTNNHRITQTFDIFFTDKMFFTPLFSQYYRDKYQNIQNRYTVGVGAGFMLIDNDKIEWEVSGGPAYLYTEFDTVAAGRDSSSKSPALVLSTSYDMELTQRIDYILDYEMTWSNKETGSYKHHMVTGFENEFTEWFDFDITLIWDYTEYPEPNADQSVPKQSDLQLLFSLGVDF